MKKNLRVSLSSLFMAMLLFIGFGNKANANSCNTTCKFSSCQISCTDPCAVACGCYFGIASCKSEFRKASPNVITKAISDFGVYANSLQNAELIGAFEILKNLKSDDTYDAVYDQYKAYVEQMSAASKELLQAYTSN